MTEDEQINALPIPGAPVQVTKENSTIGIVGFIISLAGFVAFAFPCGVAALICGIIGCQDKNKKHGLAIAAIVIGVIGILIGGMIILKSQMGLRF